MPLSVCVNFELWWKSSSCIEILHLDLELHNQLAIGTEKTCPVSQYLRKAYFSFGNDSKNYNFVQRGSNVFGSKL